MAESDSESEIPSDTSTLRHMSNSLFGIPNFLVGFGTKVPSESDSIRSPTSPLDIGVFSNFRNPVSLRYARSSSEKGFGKEWNGNKVGLGIVNLLVDDTGSGVLGLEKQKKNIIFGPQVRPNATNPVKHYRVSLDSSLRSKSLPTNYVASRLSQQTKRLDSQLSCKNIAFDNGEVPVKPKQLENAPMCFSDSNVPSSLASLRSENFCSEVKTGMSSMSEISTSSEAENSPGVKPSTVPIPIGLSAREIELSEDYTCIISHGPNPKTIHIFGDCVLECHANDSNDFGNEETQAAENTERSDPVQPHKDIFRGEKGFCSFECCSDDISEEETESSPSSSFHEDLFLLGMPVAT